MTGVVCIQMSRKQNTVELIHLMNAIDLRNIKTHMPSILPRTSIVMYNKMSPIIILSLSLYSC